MSSRQTYNFAPVPANADTLIAKGPGTLHKFVCNGSNGDIIQIYDGVNTGGVLIATIGGVLTPGQSLTYDVRFSKGLFISNQSLIGDFTVSYGI